MAFFPQIRKGLVALLLVLLIGGVVSQAEALVNFWRMAQEGVHFNFLRGPDSAPTPYAVLSPEGTLSVGENVVPQENVILKLEATDKALVVNRVTNLGGLTAQDGMMVFDETTSPGCFKFYQDGGWSACLGIIDQVRTSDTPLEHDDGAEGDIYYSISTHQLMVHNGVRYIELGQLVVKIDAVLPPAGNVGELFFTTDQRKLYIYLDGDWLELGIDFSRLMGTHGACDRIDLVLPHKQLRCPNDRLLTKVFFEEDVETDTRDNLLTPEVEAIECCDIAYKPYYWELSRWSACSATCGTGTQSRSLTCKKYDGTDAEEDDCDVTIKPTESLNRDCVLPPCITYNWQLGDWSACSKAASQSRTVECFNNFGSLVNDDRCPSPKPPETQSCVPPIASIRCDNWRYGATDTPQTGHNDPAINTGYPDCHPACRDWIMENGVSGDEYTCERHRKGKHCYETEIGRDVNPRNHRGCNDCQVKVCTAYGPPSDNLGCDPVTGQFTIPHNEWDGLDGSAGGFYKNRNNAYIDWRRCDEQVTSASVDNGGITVNFRNAPPRHGQVILRVNTRHAKTYRVKHGSNIRGNLPRYYYSNKNYVYTCHYDGSIFDCVFTQ